MDRVRMTWKRTWLIALSLLPFPIVLVLVLFVVTTQESAEPQPETAAQLVIPLALVALIELPVILVIRRMLLGSLAFAGPDEHAVTRAEPVPEEEIPALLIAAANKYYVGVVVGIAIANSIAIYGFLLGYLYGSLMPSFPFIFVGLLAALVHLPRKPALLSMIPPGAVATIRRQRLDF